MAKHVGHDYDLLIIGTGGAGTAAAIRAAEHGARTAIVEGGEVVGGTCVNIGCIPSKYLIEAAASYHSSWTGFPGVVACEPQVAWDLVLHRKRALVERLRQEKYVDVLGAYEGISLLRGRARLLGDGRVQVGDDEVRACKVVIATGASPAMPPIPGLAEAGALSSTTAMELEALPASMIVIGAGAIGLELGQAFARFGVRVSVLDVAPRILPNEDPDLTQALTDALTKEGMAFHTAVRVTRVARKEAGYVLEVRQGNEKEALRAEQLLVATGRRPNTADLGLDLAGWSSTSWGSCVWTRSCTPRTLTCSPLVTSPAALSTSTSRRSAVGSPPRPPWPKPPARRPCRSTLAPRPASPSPIRRSPPWE